MPMRGSAARATFLRFFEEQGHMPTPSSSLIPRNDPTVLLTTAGMQQMIPYFLGQETPPQVRLTSSQKCFRTTDIDSVGDASHLTFFEMLGNFSVGDYFKRDAITFAWTLLTQDFGLPAEHLFPTVHPDDDEAPGLWHEIAGMPEESITRLSDNWWGPPGASGPCGPDSEIYYDRGAEYGCGEPDCAPGCDRCERFLEIWNLVFMQFYQDTDGHRTPLKKKNIDTGMGLERLSMVLQGKDSVFDTDLFRPIIDKFAALAGTTYGLNAEHDRSLRVIADHGRALVFLAADGVRPSNEGRGYVFRRILRRAVRHGKLLGLDRPFLAEAADTVISLMGEHYTELVAQREQIFDVLTVEERKFSQTLAVGLQLLTRELETLERQGAREVPGEIAFRLYDTHGFPLELTEEVAHERGLRVDRQGYEAAMLRQQEQSQQLDIFTREQQEEVWTRIGKGIPATVFTGYEGTTGDSEILVMLADNEPADEISAPQEAAIVLRETPFYAEAGGQVGDKGTISAKSGTFVVRDTRRPIPGLTVHYGHISEGHLRVGAQVRTDVDLELRRATMRNHSATHLLHRALKDILGAQVEQRGSLVAPDRLRFDFNLERPVSPEEMREIDRRVNAWILNDLHVHTDQMPYKDAVATGAMALFSEKYGDMVRVVTMGPSKELCGGTHVHGTGQIGLYLTTQETSTGAGIRRIEALTGTGAEAYLRGRSDLVVALADRLQTQPDKLGEKVRQLQDDLTEAKRLLAQAQRAQAREEAIRLAAAPHEARGILFVAAVVAVPDDRTLREMGDVVRGKLATGVIVLGAEIEGRASFIVTVDKDLAKRGLDAGKLAGELGQRLGGRGGGRPESAQGGGKEPDRLAPAVAAIGDLIAAQVR
jgi:alanyl-tRNA synthetase